jgi:hypothetical protein
VKSLPVVSLLLPFLAFAGPKGGSTSASHSGSKSSSHSSSSATHHSTASHSSGYSTGTSHSTSTGSSHKATSSHPSSSHSTAPKHTTSSSTGSVKHDSHDQFIGWNNQARLLRKDREVGGSEGFVQEEPPVPVHREDLGRMSRIRGRPQDPARLRRVRLPEQQAVAHEERQQVEGRARVQDALTTRMQAEAAEAGVGGGVAVGVAWMATPPLARSRARPPNPRSEIGIRMEDASAPNAELRLVSWQLPCPALEDGLGLARASRPS